MARAWIWRNRRRVMPERMPMAPMLMNFPTLANTLGLRDEVDASGSASSLTGLNCENMVVVLFSLNMKDIL